MHFFVKRKQLKINGIRIGMRGQILVEALVALTIIVIGLLGIFGLISRSFALTKTVTFEYTAYNLASEGIEIAKSILDRDMFTGTAATANWGNSAIAVSPFHCLEFTSSNFGGCGAVQFLNVNTDTGEYSYALGGSQQVTPFKRRVQIVPEFAPGVIPAPLISVFVKSKVDWSSRGQNFTIEVADRFFKWRP
jgi:Tfp pilus assembly protein PilV